MSKQERNDSNFLAKLSKIKPIYRYSFFVAILILFLLVWFFSVSVVRQGIDQVTFTNDVESNSLTLENSSNLDCSGNKINTPLCQERLLALDQIKISSQFKEVLLAKNVNQWGKENFELSLSLISEGDELYRDEFFGKSVQKYAEANKLLEALDIKSFALIDELLKEGFLLLEEENSKLSLEKFIEVTLIDPLNEKAKKGVNRSKVLEELLISLNEGQMLINTGNLDAAKEKISFAVSLDSENLKAKNLLRNLNTMLRERDIRKGLDAGYALLQTRDFIAALSSFEKVISLSPSLEAAKEGLAQAKEGIKQNKIISLKEIAIENQDSEYWSTAYTTYNEILSLNPQVEFALEGKKYAQLVLNLEKELDRVLKNPKRLASQAVHEEANNLLSYSKSFLGMGPRVKSKIEELSESLEKYTEKFVLSLVSDRKTDISIERAGNLGRFTNLRVKLSPGSYVLIAKRKGYVTVRKPIEFYEDVTIELICDEKI